MKMNLPKLYEPKKKEEKIYKTWEKSGYFNPDKLPGKRPKKFSLVIPPPNITGSLHMGHALNAVIQDILVRKKRMEGYKVLWLPGTDHAGIATQNIVEKNLLKKKGKNRYDLGRQRFIQEIWKWKEKYGNEILNQLKKLGSSCDWSRTRFTMDEGYQREVQKAFVHYYKKGWIYQAERVINWCPKCQTSLSDLELEYQEEKGKLYYLKYPLVSKPFGKKFIIVATSRPETMLGDSAVAVNPADKRYKNLIGKYVKLPLVDREIPIIADGRVDKKFGSGALKVTPSHSLIDSEIGFEHNLGFFKVIGEDGRMSEGAGKYAGLDVYEARKKILEDLDKLGFVEKIEDYVHNLSKCYRCGSVIENLPSRQWFLKMDDLAKKAVKAVKSGRIKFYPKKWEKIFFDWLSKVKDWNISRQIWWGHRLPVFYCLKDLKRENFVVSLKKPKKCPFCQRCRMRQSEEVLDTWFSSALWPFAAISKKDLKVFYPTDVLSTARDIINLWVARMIFSSLEFTKKIPFKDVIIHPTILTKEGKRMSKSLGTGIDPMDYVERYGADATRFGLIWQWQAMESQDIHWSEEHIIAGRKFLNKVWNASRFILFQINKYGWKNRKVFRAAPQPLTSADKTILKNLKIAERFVSKNIDEYKFGLSLKHLYSFFWHNFCDYYLEEAKKQLNEDCLVKRTIEILVYVLISFLKLVHPFLPYISEEIWGLIIGRGNKKDLLIISSWPKLTRIKTKK